MFTRSKRLPRGLFPSVLNKGRRAVSTHLSVVYSQDVGGYAVVVSKKVARLSVTRHRVKRQLLTLLQPLSLPPSLIVFPKASAVSVSYQELKAELSALLSKIQS